MTAEIAAVIAEVAFYHLAGPIKRIGAMDVRARSSPVLEDPTVPSAGMVVAVAKALSGRLTETRERRRIASSRLSFKRS